jgi:hypothetical protein
MKSIYRVNYNPILRGDWPQKAEITWFTGERCEKVNVVMAYH